MQYEYDNEADALYVLVNEAIVARTVNVDEMTLIDVDARGETVGIEILAASHRTIDVDAICEQARLAESQSHWLIAVLGADGDNFRQTQTQRTLAHA